MSQDLQVIGAGLGRTGTTSLKLALEFLLDGRCFHFLEYRDYPELMVPWQSFAADLPIETAPQDLPGVPASRWQTLMPGYIACVDEPASFYWLPLSIAYPEALVILSTRDTEPWWNSMQTLIRHREQELENPESISPERRTFLEFEETVYATYEADFTEAAFKARFERHNNTVLDYAGTHPEFRQRLLVWNVKEGWAPLCQALNRPVPDLPFPHANKASEFHGY